MKNLFNLYERFCLRREFRILGIAGVLFMNIVNMSGQTGRVPVAVDDAYQIQEDQPLTGNVSTNDVRGDGTQTWTLVSTVSHGSLKFNPSGTFTYEPDLNYYGTDSFVYRLCDRDNECSQATVTITIASVNDPPVLTPVGNRSVCQASLLNFTAAASDPDIPANILSYSLIGAPPGAVIDASAGVFTWTPSDTQSGVYTLTVRVTDDGTPQLYDEEQITITVFGIPSPAGTITGPVTFTPGTSGVNYSVTLIPGATSYLWTYSGAGVAINGIGSSSVTLDFASDATAGQLSVRGINICGEGISSSLDLALAAKTLTLSSVLLEGLYSGAGIMRQAWNATGPQWPAGVADHITIELHDANNYSTVVWALSDVPLSISGTAEINIPAAHSGSYYITVRHRNSIETTTALPVSFAGSSISLSFGAPSAVYGGNLKLSSDGLYLVYGGDVNQDGIVDTGDMNLVDNGSAAILRGYIAADANGDGIVDTSDMNIVDNNSTAIVRVRRPN